MKKKVLVLTGIRSEYDLVKPVLELLDNDKDINLSIVVSGTHLSKFHNYSYKLILNDGFKITNKIKSFKNKFTDAERSHAVGILVSKLTKIVERKKPDFIVVVGDREEAIAASIVGNYNKILVIHIGGGDKAYGNADDPIRFASSKLAHIHCVFSKKNKNNLLKFGEENFRIFVTGNPSLSNIFNEKKVNLKKISKLLNLNLTKNKFIIFLQHPISSEVKSTEKYFLNSLKAVAEYANSKDMNIICLRPNVDPGSEKILKIIKNFKKSKKKIVFVNNLDRSIFINLMRNAYCVAGNSSMGLLETAFYKLRAINIGSRQKGRENPGNVIYVDNNKKDIINGFIKIKKIKMVNQYFYGDKHSAKNIYKIIKSIKLRDKKWLNKKKLCL